MKKPAINHILYKELFPSPSPSDPDSFLAFVHASLIPEIRFEVYTYYGSLESIEARYPGLNYTSPIHIKRLSRWPAHRNFFKAIDRLRLTAEEVYKLCCWEGTKIARDTFERQHGGKVFDRPMVGMQRVRGNIGRPPTITVHCYDEQGLETTHHGENGNNKENDDGLSVGANQTSRQPGTHQESSLVLSALPSRSRRQPLHPDSARSSRHPAGQWNEYQEWLKSVGEVNGEESEQDYPFIPSHLLFERHRRRRNQLLRHHANDQNGSQRDQAHASANAENNRNEPSPNISRSFSVYRRAVHNMDQGSPSSSRTSSGNRPNLPPLRLSGLDSDRTRPIITNELTMSPTSYQPQTNLYSSRNSSASSVVPASRVDTSISQQSDPFISGDRSTSRQQFYQLRLPSSSSSSSASTSVVAHHDECLSPSSNEAGTVGSGFRAAPFHGLENERVYGHSPPEIGRRDRSYVHTTR